MTTRTGTSHWISVAAAKEAYGAGYEDALAEGRLIIGKPALQPGDSLLTDKEGRFFIEAPDPEPVGGPGTDGHYRMTNAEIDLDPYLAKALAGYAELRARIAELEAAYQDCHASKEAFAQNAIDLQGQRGQLRAELAAIKAQEPVSEVSEETFSSDGTSDIITHNLPIGTKLYAAPVAKKVVMPEREWLQSDDLIYSLENDVNYYEINVTQVEGNRHDGKRAEFAIKLIELLNAAKQGGQDGQDE